jgi:hypothetical protein
VTGRLVRSGPWSGGLNNRDQSVSGHLLDPGQLRFAKNLDVADDGVLVSRLGCRKTGSAAMYAEIGGAGAFWVLGSVDTATKRYAVVGAHDGASPGTTVHHYTVAGASTAAGDWPATAGAALAGRFPALFQYGGFIYLVPYVNDPGPTGQRRADLTAGVWAAVAGLPAGDWAAVVRERAFVIRKSTNRVYWSKATDPTVWAAPDGGFVDVAPGDGQTITDAVVVNSQLYIFKRSRTFLLTFSADPAVDGQVTLLNGAMGAYSAVLHGSDVYVVNSRGVWRFANGYFSDVGALVDLPGYGNVDAVTDPGVFANVERDQLVVGPMVNTALTSHFAMNLRTGAWSGRSYPDPLACAPSTQAAFWRDSAPPPAGGGAGVVYGHRLRFLGATRTRSPFGDPTASLDVDTAGVTVSPEYSVNVPELVAGDAETWKRLHYVAVRAYCAPAPGDADLTLAPLVGPNLGIDAQPATVIPKTTVPTGYYTQPLVFTAALDDFETRAGYRPDLFKWFISWTMAFPAANVAAVAARGQIPMLTWMPDVEGGGNPSTNANIVAGTWDAYIDTFAAAVRAYGQPVWVELGPEMNGNGWFQWQTVQFVAMWNHVRARFAAAGATNVVWVWSPNVADQLDYIPLADVFPGVAAVDKVGMHGYNWGNPAPAGHTSVWRSFSTIFDSTISALRLLAPGLPLWVTETASAEAGGSKAGWIRDAFAQVRGYGLDGLIWFDADKTLDGETDWRISSSAAAQAAFAAGTPIAFLDAAKVPIRSYRFTSTSFRLRKAVTSLGATSPDTSHQLVLKEVLAYVSGYARRVNVG